MVGLDGWLLMTMLYSFFMWDSAALWITGFHEYHGRNRIATTSALHRYPLRMTQSAKLITSRRVQRLPFYDMVGNVGILAPFAGPAKLTPAPTSTPQLSSLLYPLISIAAAAP